MTDPNETLPLVQAYKEIDQLKAELDGIKSRQETDLTEQKRVVAGLIQIASSLPSDEDVFHPKSVETAKDALALIDQLYLSNMGYGYAIEVLRRNMGLDNTSHDFSECLETFNNLKAELAKAQDENARLLAMLTELYCDPLIGATRAQKIHCALFGQSNALRDLLAPTIELLKDGVLSWEGEGPAISRARFEVEMTRLKAKLEGKV